jgi:hypothetical protein
MLLSQNLSRPSFLFFFLSYHAVQPAANLPCTRPKRGPRASRLLPGDRTEASEGGLVPNGINTNPNKLGGLLESIFHTSRNVLGL